MIRVTKPNGTIGIYLWDYADGMEMLCYFWETAVSQALHELAQLEAHCEAHTHTIPKLIYNDEGFLFIVRGQNAFIFARRGSF